MEQDIEQKLKLENDLATVRRELKNVTAQLVGAKNEYNLIGELIEKNKVLLSEQKEYLQTVINDISAQKVAWLQEKNADILKLEEKMSEADNIIKRKAELNEQEATINKLLEKDNQVLNETRQLELKIGDEKTALAVRERDLEEKKSAIDSEREGLAKSKEDFKVKVYKILREVEKI